MRSIMALFLTVLALATTLGCGGNAPDEEAEREAVVTALDAFATELAADRPTGCGRVYGTLAGLPGGPSIILWQCGRAVLDRWGIVISSPYVYRTADGYASSDLAAPSYNIEEQDWLIAPLTANAGVWTDPYFDAGGGEIWMITRSLYQCAMQMGFSSSSPLIWRWTLPPSNAKRWGGAASLDVTG